MKYRRSHMHVRVVFGKFISWGSIGERRMSKIAPWSVCHWDLYSFYWLYSCFANLESVHIGEITGSQSLYRICLHPHKCCLHTSQFFYKPLRVRNPSLISLSFTMVNCRLSSTRKSQPYRGSISQTIRNSLILQAWTSSQDIFCVYLTSECKRTLTAENICSKSFHEFSGRIPIPWSNSSPQWATSLKNS